VAAEQVSPGNDGAAGPSSTERLVLFSDAVFAIVITLLVLPLAAEFEAPAESGSLSSAVWEQWPRMLSFLVSFLVIGQFWIAHHTMFERIDKRDHALLWLNLLFLLTISFQPFPTAVLGARLDSEDQFPVVFYAASMALSSLALTITWVYARHQALTVAGPERELRTFTARAVATTAVFVASILVAFAGLWAAALCWLLMLPLARRLATRAVARRTQPQDGSQHAAAVEPEGVLDA
jgi:uncharacterized membrane protein